MFFSLMSPTLGQQIDGGGGWRKLFKHFPDTFCITCSLIYSPPMNELAGQPRNNNAIIFPLKICLSQGAHVSLIVVEGLQNPEKLTIFLSNKNLYLNLRYFLYCIEIHQLNMYLLYLLIQQKTTHKLSKKKKRILVIYRACLRRNICHVPLKPACLPDPRPLPVLSGS